MSHRAAIWLRWLAAPMLYCYGHRHPIILDRMAGRLGTITCFYIYRRWPLVIFQRPVPAARIQYLDWLHVQMATLMVEHWAKGYISLFSPTSFYFAFNYDFWGSFIFFFFLFCRAEQQMKFLKLITSESSWCQKWSVLYLWLFVFLFPSCLPLLAHRELEHKAILNNK